jgi:ribonuclease HI
MTNLLIHTDGGARGNPGPAAIGVVIQNKESGVITKIGVYIGHATNNQAEYSALIEALQNAQKEKPSQVECLLDSELVVKQLNGEYKVKEPTIKKLWARVKELEKTFPQITYKHIPREKNKEADKIVNEVLDATRTGQ